MTQTPPHADHAHQAAGTGTPPREHAIDALRGFALLGILVVNAGSFASTYFGLGVADPAFSRPVDHAVRWWVSFVFETKFYLLLRGLRPNLARCSFQYSSEPSSGAAAIIVASFVEEDVPSLSFPPLSFLNKVPYPFTFLDFRFFISGESASSSWSPLLLIAFLLMEYGRSLSANPDDGDDIGAAAADSLSELCTGTDVSSAAAVDSSTVFFDCLILLDDDWPVRSFHNSIAAGLFSTRALYLR